MPFRLRGWIDSPIPNYESAFELDWRIGLAPRDLMMPDKNFFANAALVLASTFLSVTLLLAAGEMILR